MNADGGHRGYVNSHSYYMEVHTLTELQQALRRKREDYKRKKICSNNVETKRPIIPISITLMALLNILKELESDISPLYALFYLIITTNTASSIYYVWPPGCKEPNQDGNCICPKLWTPFSSLIYFNLQFDLCS